MGAAEREDGVGTGHCPEHAGLFEAMADYRLAACFDDAGADKQVLLAELGIVHTSGVGDEVIGFVADLLSQVGIGSLYGIERGDQFCDFPFIEPTLLMEADPGVTLLALGGVQQACQVP